MKFSIRYLSTLYILSISIIFSSCKSGSVNIFKAATPHEQYQRKLAASGLDKTAMGSLWLNSATISLEKALNISIPFKEVGYFSAEKATATAYKFNAIKGQTLTISLSKKPLNGASIYVDVWQVNANNTKLVASADTLNNNILFDIDESGTFLIRLQPELLQSIEYNLEITSGPSQGFPTRTGLNNVKSYFGDGRDANSRKHEGVDIFGSFRSPVIATSDGTIVRVNENNLGGKVVWFRPKNKDYTLYYAHLDEQLVTAGQEVLVGDTLGLMGNTGNAKTTPPHLHFGLYTSGGAIDPLPFIKPTVKKPANITASTSNLNRTLRTNQNTFLYSSPVMSAQKLRTIQNGTILIANSASANWYKAELPDGTIGFIQSSNINQTEKPLQKLKLKRFQTEIYDKPDSLALVKLTLNEAQNVSVLGNFGNYHLISDDKEQVGWIKK